MRAPLLPTHPASPQVPVHQQCALWWGSPVLLITVKSNVGRGHPQKTPKTELNQAHTDRSPDQSRGRRWEEQAHLTPAGTSELFMTFEPQGILLGQVSPLLFHYTNTPSTNGVFVIS